MSWTTHRDVDETRDVITDLFNVGDEPTWLIERRDTDELVGTCGWISATATFSRFRVLSVPQVVAAGARIRGGRNAGRGRDAQSRRIPGLGVLPRRQRGVGGCAAALRPKPRRPARAVSRYFPISLQNPRTACCSRRRCGDERSREGPWTCCAADPSGDRRADGGRPVDTGTGGGRVERRGARLRARRLSHRRGLRRPHHRGPSPDNRAARASNLFVPGPSAATP